VGAVWAPLPGFSLTVDYHSWEIENDIGPQDAKGLTLRELYCRTGQNGYDIDSPVCQDALSKITRNATGAITEIYTPKVNEALRSLEVVTAAISYAFDAGNIGSFLLRSSYTNTLKQELTRFPGDTPIDLLRNPLESSDPKTKVNASVTWSSPGDMWGTTLYANRIGSIPNYRAQVDGNYDDPTAGKLGSYTTYNASLDFRPIEALTLSLMVNNLLDDTPPEDHTFPGSSGAPYDSSQYTAYGRSMYVEARYEFGK
jgi:hypothetical protein